MRVSLSCFANNALAGFPSTVRLARTYPRFFAKEDLPEPKKPEIQTPIPSVGVDLASTIALSNRR